MNIIVTGATSMIGGAVIESAIKRGDHVLAIVRHGCSRLDRLPQSSKMQIFEADLDQLNSLRNPKDQYDVFFHFAWGDTAKSNRDDPELQELNIRYELEAVKLAHRLGCKRFVHAGSQAEYGLKNETITAETHPDPISAYGMAKLSAGMLGRKLCWQYDMAHIWLRIFSVYGPYDGDNTMISYAIDSFFKGIEAKFSAATNVWNYLYSSDAGEMIYRLGNSGVPEGIYCIAGERSLSLKSYIQQIASSFHEAQYSFASEDSAIQLVNLNVDASKTFDVTNYRPEVPFETGIRKVIECRTMKRKWIGD